MPRDNIFEAPITADTPGAVWQPEEQRGRGTIGGYWRMPTAMESAASSLSAQMAALPQNIKDAIAAGQLQPQYSTVNIGGRNGEGPVSNGIIGFTSPGPNDTYYTYDLSGTVTGQRQVERGGGGFLGGLIGGISNALADLDSSLKLSENAPVIAAIGIGVLTAGAGTALGASMANAGLLTTAAEASAATLAATGSATAAAAAGAAATATATAVGTAIVSAGVQVAQGKPLDQALGSAATSLLTSQVVNPAIASEVKSVISSPLVASTVTNMGTSLASGVLTGKTEDQIVNSVLQAGAGTVINSAANDIVKNTPGLNDPSLPPEAKQVALAGIVGAIATGDGTKSMVNAAISVGTKALLDNFPTVLKPAVVATLQDTHDTATADDPQLAGDTYANFVDQLSSPTTGPAEDFAAGPPVPGAAPFDDVGPVFQAPGATQTAAITDDVNTLIGQGVDPNLALSMALEWQAPITGMTGGEQTAVADTGVVSDAGDSGTTATTNLSPAALESLVGTTGYGTNQSALDFATDTGFDTSIVGSGAESALPVDIGAGTVPATNNEAVASGMSPGSVGAQEAVTGGLTDAELAGATGIDTSGLDALTTVPVTNNEAVASGMSPGSVGAQEAVTGGLTDAELAGATGIDTSGLDALTTTPTPNNEAVASGMSPGSVGAQEAVTGGLTDAELAGATGVDTGVDIPDYTDDLYASEDQDPNFFHEQRGVDDVADLGTVTITGTPDELSPLVDMGETTSTKIPEVIATTPAVTPVTTPVIKPPVVAKPVATTTGALPTTSYTDSTAPVGRYATVGKMGYDMPQTKLKQLYESLLSPQAPSYEYADDESPEYLNIAQLTSAPFVQPQQPMYARGGLVHLAEGGNTDVIKALKQLGEVGSEMKPSKHDLRQVGQMGAPYVPKVLPQLAALLQSRGMKLAEGGQPDDHTHPNYDGTPLLRTGGLSGLGGKYVEGKGDGTSDDIAAMLANGEYVFSADVVAALGNGSNKAGAEELDKMVQAIRARARSAPPDKLPPDAKSPLEYLKSSKGKKNG